MVELGAGTGLGTAVLAPLTGHGGSLTCVEPDPRMADQLRAEYPQAQVQISTFEQWTPPPGGVDVLACALAWHWLDPDTRSSRARDALAPTGTLAVFGHTYAFTDPAQRAALDEVYQRADPTGKPRSEHWFHDEIAASGCFTEVTLRTYRRTEHFDIERYLQLTDTFSHVRHMPGLVRDQLHAGLREAITATGGTVGMDLRTALVLARPALG